MYSSIPHGLVINIDSFSHLPKTSIVAIPNPHEIKTTSNGATSSTAQAPVQIQPDPTSIPKIPQFYKEKLKRICPHCKCKMKILWKNFNRNEHHFDACFRYYDDPKKEDDDFGKNQNRCFLKRLSPPYLNEILLTLASLHP